MTRLRSQEGFGLIELVMAMTILNIGLLAIVASFNSGALALRRASKVTTASVLADQQIELYRAIKYDAIRLDPGSLPTDATYTTDRAYTCSGCTPITTPACTGTPLPNECNASRTVPGADGRDYRLDVFIVNTAPPGGRTMKKVTVVVRDGMDTSRTWVRQSTTFDKSTG